MPHHTHGKSPKELSFRTLLHAAADPKGNWHGMKIYAVDANSGTVLINIGGDNPHNPASLTKLMTFYLACKALDGNAVSLKDMGKTEAIPGNKNKWDIRPNREKSFDELVSIMMTASDNNAANAVSKLIKAKLKQFEAYEKLSLPEKIAYNKAHPDAIPNIHSFEAKKNLENLRKYADDIPSMMNEVAKEIGMTNTRFVNSDGLYRKEEGANRTTPHDMALLMKAIYTDHRAYAETYLNQAEVHYDGGTHKAHYFLNDPSSHMALPAGIKAVAKTGYLDSPVGFNINARVTDKDGRAMIVTILGAAQHLPVAVAKQVGLAPEVIASEIAATRHSHGDRGHPIRGNRIENAMVNSLVAAKLHELTLPIEKPAEKFVTPTILAQDAANQNHHFHYGTHPLIAPPDATRVALTILKLPAETQAAIQQHAESIKHPKEFSAPITAPNKKQPTQQR